MSTSAKMEAAPVMKMEVPGVADLAGIEGQKGMSSTGGSARAASTASR